MKGIFAAIIVLVSLQGFAQESAQIKVPCDKKKSTITYAMSHTLHDWTGECSDVSSVILTDAEKNEIRQVAVVVKFASFDSKNANRDSHAIEAAEAIKFPTISFSSTDIKQVGDKLKVTGALVFHGISHSITFEAQKKIAKNNIEVTGGFSIKMTDYGIKPPTLLGMATEDEIKISFNMVY